MTAVLAIVAVVVVLLVLVFALSVKIVREYQRIVLFRLGRSLGPRGPGLVLLNPNTDRSNWVDLREQYLEIPHQSAITRDNAAISIDFIIFYKFVDPAMSVLQVQNFAGAAQNIAATTLRSIVGDMPLDDILSKREEMNSVLRIKLDDVTERWGVKVTNVEGARDQPAPRRCRRPWLRVRCRPSAPVGPWSPSPREPSKRPSPSPRARSSPPFCRRKATGRPPSCGRKASRWPWTTSPPWPAVSTPTRCCCSTSTPCVRWPAPPPPRCSCPWRLTNLLAGVRDLAVNQLGPLGAAASNGAGVGADAAAGVWREGQAPDS